MYVYGMKYKNDDNKQTYLSENLELVKNWYELDRMDEHVERCLYLVYSKNWENNNEQ